MASKAFVKGWAISAAPFNTYSNPHFLSFCFQTAHWSWEENRKLDEIPMERI